MLSREELLKTNEYWLEILQNEIYRNVAEYIKKEGNSQTKLAEKLGVSKGYISQIMNGNFNYTLKKMIELSLAIGKAPDIVLKDIDQFISEDRKNRFEMQYQSFLSIETESKVIPLHSGITAITECKESSTDNSTLFQVA